jgi:hypothetical protein
VESEGPSVGKVGECDVASRHLQGCSPRLCRLRTDVLPPREQVLNVPIACWCYGPSKPMQPVVKRCLDLITTSMVLLGEKLGDGPADRSTGVLGIISGALFLGSSRVRPMLLMATERLSRT